MVYIYYKYDCKEITSSFLVELFNKLVYNVNMNTVISRKNEVLFVSLEAADNLKRLVSFCLNYKDLLEAVFPLSKSNEEASLSVNRVALRVDSLFQSIIYRRINPPGTFLYSPKTSSITQLRRLHYQPLYEDSFSSDLEVYNDDFFGALPVNGIRQLDYQKTSHVFDMIFLGETKFSIQEDIEFINQIKNAFRMLFARSLGRELILTILKDKDIEWIVIKKGTYSRQKTIQEGAFIEIDTNKSVVVTQTEDGKKTPLENPIFMRVVHELIHLLVHESYVNFPPTIGKDFANLNEQIVITGQGGPTYSKFNENNFRKLFNLPLRCNHKGRVI